MIDGEWATVDVTWNDSETTPNAYFNIPDSVAALTRAEDNGYILDEYYGSYTAQSDANEYYHVTDRFYGLDQVVSVLAQELSIQNVVTLRTDYELSDAQLAQIIESLTAQLQVQLYGNNSEGVITVRKL